MSDYKPIGTGYKPAMSNYKPIGKADSTSAFNTADPAFMAFHASNVAMSGGEQSMGGSALPRKLKFQGGPFKGMTQADAMQASTQRWQALTPEERAKFGPPSASRPMASPSTAAPPASPMTSAPASPAEAVGNVASAIQASPRVQSSFVPRPPAIEPVNGALDRSPSMARFASGMVTTAANGSKTAATQYGTGSATFAPRAPTTPPAAPVPPSKPAAIAAPVATPVQAAQQNLQAVRDTNTAMAGWQSTAQPPLMPAAAPFSPAGMRSAAPTLTAAPAAPAPARMTAAPAMPVSQPAPAAPAAPAAPPSIESQRQQAMTQLESAAPGMDRAMSAAGKAVQTVGNAASTFGKGMVKGAVQRVGTLASRGTFVPRLPGKMATGLTSAGQSVAQFVAPPIAKAYVDFTQGDPAARMAAQAKLRKLNTARTQPPTTLSARERLAAMQF